MCTMNDPHSKREDAAPHKKRRGRWKRWLIRVEQCITDPDALFVARVLPDYIQSIHRRIPICYELAYYRRNAPCKDRRPERIRAACKVLALAGLIYESVYCRPEEEERDHGQKHSLGVSHATSGQSTLQLVGLCPLDYHRRKNVFSMKDKAQLEEELAIVLALIAQKEPTFLKRPGFDVGETFHLGMVGRGGKPSQRLNKKKIAAMDRSIDQAAELTELYRKRDSLKRQIETYDQVMAQKERREAQRQAAIERIKHASPGMEVITMFGNPVTIKRVNRKSITTTSGTRYTFAELVDVVQPTKEEGASPPCQ